MDALTITNRINNFFSKTREVIGEDSYLKLFDEYGAQKKVSALPLNDILSILNKLNVTLDSVIENRVDFDVLATLKKGQAMPMRYLEKAALSSRFTGMYMLNHISKTFGEKSAKKILQNFQLTENQLKDFRLKNNILLPLDLCNYVFRYHGAQAVQQMGEHSVSLLGETEYGQLLAESPNLQFMLEFFFEDIAPNYVEKNYSWEIIESNSDSIVISGHPNQVILDSFHMDLRENESLVHLRNGFLKALPSLLGLYKVEIEILKSVSQGDDLDLYRLSYKVHPPH